MLRRVLMMLSAVFTVSVVATIVGLTIVNAETANAWSVARMNLRSTSLQGTVVGTLQVNVPVVLEGRNTNASWLLVHVQDNPGQRGWGAASLFKLAAGIKL